jgi:hypothetical protein
MIPTGFHEDSKRIQKDSKIIPTGSQQGSHRIPRGFQNVSKKGIPKRWPDRPQKNKIVFVRIKKWKNNYSGIYSANHSTGKKTNGVQRLWSSPNSLHSTGY